MHAYCAFCGAAVALEVHHIRPYHLHPELELDPANFVTLCEGSPQCHLHVGHLGNWDSFNPALIADPTLHQVVGSVAWRIAQRAPPPSRILWLSHSQTPPPLDTRRPLAP